MSQTSLNTNGTTKGQRILIGIRKIIFVGITLLKVYSEGKTIPLEAMPSLCSGDLVGRNGNDAMLLVPNADVPHKEWPCKGPGKVFVEDVGCFEVGWMRVLR